MVRTRANALSTEAAQERVTPRHRHLEAPTLLLGQQLLQTETFLENALVCNKGGRLHMAPYNAQSTIFGILGCQ